MEADPDDRQFVVEMDAKRRARLRFGDGEHGQSPASGTQFFAEMRLGGGSAGNVGANRIVRVVVRQNALVAIDGVRNPMPAVGGTDPESIEQAKLLAPHAFQKNQPRALIASDYSRLAQARFSDQIQSIYAALRHAGTFVWVDVALDPKSDVLDSQQLVRDVQQYLDHVRKIGHLVRVTLQTPVPVDLRLHMVADSRFPQQSVHGAIVARLSDQPLEDGKFGFFHPDRMTLGQSIHSNAIVHEVMQVPGVITARVIHFGRLDATPSPASKGTSTHGNGPTWSEFELQLGPLEVATLDRNRKCGGRLTLTLEGGR
jgi:predicted phage baseplate assembly protein